MPRRFLIESAPESFQLIVDAIPQPVFMLDRQHRVVMVNEALCTFFGLLPGEIVGTTGSEHASDAQRAVFWRADDQVFETDESIESEDVVNDRDGVLHVVTIRKRLIHVPGPEGERPFIIGVVSDITRFREAEARAQYLAEHDGLTGLINRTQLAQQLGPVVEAAEKTQGGAAVLLLDLDGFQAVNDHHGHGMGDKALQIVGKRLAGLVRSVDIVSRFAGDEFCVVQTGLPQPEAAFDLARRILAQISQPLSIGTTRLSLSASIGIAIYPEDAQDGAGLLQKAGYALSAGKKEHRGRYRRPDGGSAPVPPPDWNVAEELRIALAADQLSVAFQPLVAAYDGRLRAFEALARWKHPVHGDISPEVFIPVAESNGLIHQLGGWVLHAACAQAACWPWEAQVCVNVSPLQLETGDLVAMVEGALASSGLPASRLELEITETALLGGAGIAPVFETLKGLGVSLSLDDFGAGWSSLSTLRAFRFDRLKIDRSFMTHVATDVRSVAIVRAVLSLGQALDLPVTAEGIEEHAQFVALRKMGCAEFQGYYFGRPSLQATEPDRAAWRPFFEPPGTAAPRRRRADMGLTGTKHSLIQGFTRDPAGLTVQASSTKERR